MNWTTGYSVTQLDDAQARYGLTFPPDLVALLRERRPLHGYEWDREDPRIREMLVWPLDMLQFDIEHEAWWPDWGERPAAPEECSEVLRAALAKAPRLIPLLGHRFLPETPSEAGNPVFSMHGFDTIHYGANLAEYFAHEFDRVPSVSAPRHIPFWSDIATDHERAYADFVTPPDNG